MFLLSKIDWYLVLPAAFLALLGSLILKSVSPDTFAQHLVYLLAAVLVYVFFANVDIKILKSLSPYFYGFSLAFLFLTLIFGTLSRGATRWLGFGAIAFQPSEITKPIFILFFSYLLSKTNGMKRFFWAILAFVPAFLLIAFQPDLGSAIIVFAGFFGNIFLAEIPLSILGVSILIPLFTSPVLWNFLASYQKQRIESFLSPTKDPLGTGYNSIQAIIAVGTGSLFGRGLGQGTQSQLAFLPERHTDFIFASLSEELGFLGAILVIGAFVGILFRIILLIRDSQDSFTRSFLGGAFFILFAQVVINIGMNLAVLPVAGIPLPFVSAGGSSLLSMSAILGMVSSIGKNKNQFLT